MELVGRDSENRAHLVGMPGETTEQQMKDDSEKTGSGPSSPAGCSSNIDFCLLAQESSNPLPLFHRNCSLAVREYLIPVLRTLVFEFGFLQVIFSH